MNLLKLLLKKVLGKQNFRKAKQKYLYSTQKLQTVNVSKSPDIWFFNDNTKDDNNYPHKIRTNVYNDEEIQRLEQKISEASWYHSFELIPRLVTPGMLSIDAAEILDFLDVPKNLEGKQALDIGAWDGPISFELERRGASTIAVDIQNPDNTGFNTAKDILGSNVQYFQSTVYNLTSIFSSMSFDLICFFGVFYHLKHPILAFEEISKVLKNDGILIFEGECLLNYAETPKASSSGLTNNNEVLVMANSSLPITLCYPGLFKGSSNWFVPNVSCIFSWLQACGLEMICYHLHNDRSSETGPLQRITGIAKKARPEITEEHPIVPKHWR